MDDSNLNYSLLPFIDVAVCNSVCYHYDTHTKVKHFYLVTLHPLVYAKVVAVSTEGLCDVTKVIGWMCAIIYECAPDCDQWV